MVDACATAVALTQSIGAIYRETQMHNWVKGPPGNYVAGLEIGVSHARAVVLGYGHSTEHAPPWVRLVHAAAVPMPDGAISGADILEPRTVARVLVDVFGGPDDIARWAMVHLAIGLPPSTVLIRSVAFGELVRRHSVRDMSDPRRRRRGSEFGLDVFEESVIDEAERLMALDRDELCVDWFRSVSVEGEDHATIVATTRQQVLSRVNVAALAGLRATVVDGDAEAALRACRFWMHVRHAADDTYIVIWRHATDARTWCVFEHAVEITLEGQGALDLHHIALWARDRKPRIVVVAGDGSDDVIRTLESRDIMRKTGCVADRFNPRLCCVGVDVAEQADSDEGFAIAFGLALRGVA